MHIQVEKIHKHRDYWHEKARGQIEEAFFRSLEGDSQKFQAMCEDVETSLMIVWRMDQKLRNANGAE